MEILSLLIGLFLIVIAVFASSFGLDNNFQWGTSRYVLLVAGLLFSSVFLAIRLERKFHYSVRFPAVQKFFAGVNRILDRIINSTIPSAAAAILILTSISIYGAWYTSQGHFPQFRSEYNYYVELGDAFLHGQLSLLEKPDPRLAALEDPVRDVAAREKISYRLDLSYYEGKYYLYWGPIPSLLNAVLQVISGEKPGGAVAPLTFYTFTGLFLAIILFCAQRWAYPNAPGISIALFLLAALVNIPYVFMLSRNSVYETAIFAGQCFLFLGIAGWLAYLMTHQPPWLVLAGSGYALAVGSRYNLALAVMVCLGFAAWEFRRKGLWSRSRLRRLLLLLAPLIFMGLLLTVYNYARFGNPLQTGLEFQLADPNFKRLYYSPGFILSNLYVYLFNPAAFRPSFPFIITMPIQPDRFPAWAQMAYGKEFEYAMLGTIPWVPIFWMLVILIPVLSISLKRGREARQKFDDDLHPPAAQHFVLMLFLAGVTETIHTLLYYYGAMRFIADFYLLYLLAMVFASWEVDRRLQRLAYPYTQLLRTTFWGATALLAAATAIIGFLSGFEIPPQLFRLHNYEQYIQVSNPFNHLFAVAYSMINW